MCILGGNGSGKSTLAKHVNALLVPDEGSVTVLDRDTRDERPPTSSAATPAWCSRTPTTSWWQASSKTTWPSARRPGRAHRPAAPARGRRWPTWAAGLRQARDRGAVGRAEATRGHRRRAGHGAAILILDEATAMLDPRGRKGLMRVCHELHDRGMTVVMITHFMEEAAQADRVIVLEEGRVACDGTPQDVLVQAELLEHLNLDLPFAAELSLELGRRGVPVGMHIETTTLKEELCRLLSKA
ncbi:MAG: ATP-binding cassette domain-containing protein [Eggerthella lenta]